MDSGIMVDTGMRSSPLIPEELAEEVLQGFRDRHPLAGAPKLFFAPGRVNLMGAHLDYSGGAVLPAAIDRGTLIAVAPRSDGRVHFSSSLQAGDHLFELSIIPFTDLQSPFRRFKLDPSQNPALSFKLSPKPN